MPTKLSVDEIRAVAEAAVTAKYAADAAKAALDADPENQTLKDALTTAETAAADAKTKADALSQTTKKTPEQIAKMKRKMAIIKRDLNDAGELEEDEDDDDFDTDEDPDRPVTFKDLERIERQKATNSASEMVNAIEDTVARAAVQAALKRVAPSGNPAQDFADAVAIANRDKNNKILEELGRKVIPNAHQSGAGSPPKKPDAEFTPTTDEAKYMRPPFNLSPKDILEYRKKTEALTK